MSSKKELEEDIHLLKQRVAELMEMTSVLNNALVALGFAVKVKGTELDKVKPEDYTKFVVDHIHPLTLRATEIVHEVAVNTKKEIEDEASKEK